MAVRSRARPSAAIVKRVEKGVPGRVGAGDDNYAEYLSPPPRRITTRARDAIITDVRFRACRSIRRARAGTSPGSVRDECDRAGMFRFFGCVWTKSAVTDEIRVDSVFVSWRLSKTICEYSDDFGGANRT